MSTIFSENNETCVADLNTWNKINIYVLGLIGVGFLAMMFGFCHVFFWNTVAERQICRIRCALFKGILEKHIGWFDVRDARALNSELFE